MSTHTDRAGSAPKSGVVLWWLPVGAGGHVVVHTSRWWERLDAWRAERSPQSLFHAALEVFAVGHPWVIEMAPQWGGPKSADRGAVMTGPVGARILGRSSLFRYEVRCWRDGLLPDREWAVGGPVTVADDEATARRVLRLTHEVPALTWGREVERTGDMWNSNSLVAWVLARSGVPTTDLAPPGGGRAPGWAAGLWLAQGSQSRRPAARSIRG